MKILALFVAVNTNAWIAPQKASEGQGSVSFQLFYDELSPYGTWVDYQTYGYVWMPKGDSGFRPYATAGRWVLTDDGWTWDSDYPWGWATFHYGRWDYDNVYGWLWVPGNEWGPAWVSWRRSPGYYGWAPLSPGGKPHERNERWIFVRDRDFTRSDIDRHYVDLTNNAAIIKHSTVIANTQRDNKRRVTYLSGPNRDDVQRATRTTIRSVIIRETDQPGRPLNNGELQMYRPQLQKNNGNRQNSAPSKVMKLSDVRTASEKNAEDRTREVHAAGNYRNAQPGQPNTSQDHRAQKEHQESKKRGR
ncbi:MAG: DUF6600 domain-containing protein [Bacteroidota bacterium]